MSLVNARLGNFRGPQMKGPGPVVCPRLLNYKASIAIQSTCSKVTLWTANTAMGSSQQQFLVANNVQCCLSKICWRRWAKKGCWHQPPLAWAQCELALSSLGLKIAQKAKCLECFVRCGWTLPPHSGNLSQDLFVIHFACGNPRRHWKLKDM